MIATWIGMLLLAAAPSGAKALCPAQAGGPPFTRPTPEAAQLGVDARKVYDRKDFAGAAQLFRQSLQRDPGFLSARINLASALARAQRLDEAATEAVATIDAAFVPGWFRVQDATDLLVLQSSPQWKRIEAAVARAAPLWGANVNKGLLVIARTGPGVKSGAADKPGVYVVSPHQEVFSWDPVKGGFRQVTAEEGRVIAAVHDRRSAQIVYARAEKLARLPSAAPEWRGLTLRILDLGTMRPSERIPVPDGLSEISLTMEPVRGRVQSVLRGRLAGRVVAFVVTATGLAPHDARPRRNVREKLGEPGCHFRAEQVLTPEPRIRIIRDRGSVFELNTPFGAFLNHATP